MSDQQDQVVDRISRILTDKIVTGNPLASDISADTQLLSTGLNLDSVAVLELVMEIENQFGIEFDDADMSVDLLKSVGSVAAYVRQKLPGTAA